MAIYVISVRTLARSERLVVVAASNAEALAKSRATRSMAPPDAFRIVERSEGDTLVLRRGRPPSARRLAAQATWAPFEASSIDGRDIG